MTNHHPLTNEICSELTRTHPLTDKIISKQFGRYDGIDDVMVYDEDDMRAAYDLGRAEQLEQVMTWLDENLNNYTDDNYLGDCQPFYELIPDLEKAMRPTQENN